MRGSNRNHTYQLFIYYQEIATLKFLIGTEKDKLMNFETIRKKAIGQLNKYTWAMNKQHEDNQNKIKIKQNYKIICLAKLNRL